MVKNTVHYDGATTIQPITALVPNLTDEAHKNADDHAGRNLADNATVHETHESCTGSRPVQSLLSQELYLTSYILQAPSTNPRGVSMFYYYRFHSTCDDVCVRTVCTTGNRKTLRPTDGVLLIAFMTATPRYEIPKRVVHMTHGDLLLREIKQHECHYHQRYVSINNKALSPQYRYCSNFQSGPREIDRLGIIIGIFGQFQGEMLVAVAQYSMQE